MRKINFLQTLCALSTSFLAALLTFVISKKISDLISGEGPFYSLVFVMIFLPLFYSILIFFYRVFLFFFPMPIGPIEKESQQEFIYHVHLLIFLLFIHPITRTAIIPVPLMRLIYLGLGAKLGANTYSPGTLLDPGLTKIGDNCIIGHNSVIFAHVVEGDYLATLPVEIGNNVTIGAHAIIMPGVIIEDGAIVSAGAVVSKGTHIGPSEVWGSVLAKKIR